MTARHRVRLVLPRVLVALAAGAFSIGVTSIDTSSAGAAGTVPLSNSFGYKYGYAAAKAELPKLYAGTSSAVNPTPRPAAKNKTIVVISAGQSSISSSIPSDAAVAAAKAIGWKVTLLDGMLNPSLYGGLISQAIAMGAQGIILDAVDCDVAKGPLEQAKAKHIVVVPIYAYDCNDPTENAGPPLFTDVVNFNNIPDKNLGAFAESYGRGQADAVIAKSKNKAQRPRAERPGVHRPQVHGGRVRRPDRALGRLQGGRHPELPGL